MKKLSIRNTFKLLNAFSGQNKPLSAPELLRSGVDLKRSTLYTTIDMLIDFEGGKPLLKQVTYHDEKTRYRFQMTEEGRDFLKVCQGTFGSL